MSSSPQSSPSADDDRKTLHDGASPEVLNKYDSSIGEIKQQAGVSRMEAIARVVTSKQNRGILIGLGLALYACNWVMAMEGSTTYLYAIWATSDFQQHSSGLASLNIATSIIASVCVPFLAKFADVFSRAWVYLIALVAYVVGFIIIAFAPTLIAYIVGSVAVAIGGAAIGLLNNVVCADLISTQWRGVMFGVLSTPYLATAWYTSSIAAALGTEKNWRWGYGMYCIIMPVIIGPAVVVVLYLERKIRKLGLIAEAREEGVANPEDLENKNVDTVEAVVEPKKPLKARAYQVFQEMDTIGLLLLGFGFSLLLLPFSLSAYANNGYKNPSLIAMFCIGPICLILYAFWEIRYAKFPTAPKRLLKNRTFMTAIILNFIYMCAGYLNLTYVYSYTYVVTDFNDREQNYYNNILTMTLCGAGLIWGILQRITHRYKFLQIFGLTLKLIGMGLFVSKSGVRSEAQLIMGQILIGIGGSASVIASQISSQASVPHQDVALVISLITLWTAVGGGIGSAISAAIWNNTLPGKLLQYLPASVTEEERTLLFGDITAIKAYPLGDPVREGCIQAYIDTVYPMWALALGMSAIAVIVAFFQTNYYLGPQQNSVTNTDTAGRPVNVPTLLPRPDTLKGRLLRFWDM